MKVQLGGKLVAFNTVEPGQFIGFLEDDNWLFGICALNENAERILICLSSAAQSEPNPSLRTAGGLPDHALIYDGALLRPDFSSAHDRYPVLGALMTTNSGSFIWVASMHRRQITVCLETGISGQPKDGRTISFDKWSIGIERGEKFEALIDFAVRPN